jgi:uncharacterized integral membrane protein
MGLVRAIVGFTLAILFVVFAIANRQTVAIVWSPLNPPFELPLYLVALGLLALGFLLGSLMMWLDFLPNRLGKNREIRQLKKELKGKQSKAVVQENWTALPPTTAE